MENKKKKSIKYLLLLFTLLCVSCADSVTESGNDYSKEKVVFQIELAGINNASEEIATRGDKKTEMRESRVPYNKDYDIVCQLFEDTTQKAMTRAGTTALASRVRYRVIAYKQNDVSQNGYINHVDCVAGDKFGIALPKGANYTIIAVSENSTKPLPAFKPEETSYTGAQLFEKKSFTAEVNTPINITFNHLLSTFKLIVNSTKVTLENTERSWKIDEISPSTLNGIYTRGEVDFVSGNFNKQKNDVPGTKKLEFESTEDILQMKSKNSEPYYITTHGEQAELQIPSLKIDGVTVVPKSLSIGPLRSGVNYIATLNVKRKLINISVQSNYQNGENVGGYFYPNKNSDYWPKPTETITIPSQEELVLQSTKSWYETDVVVPPSHWTYKENENSEEKVVDNTNPNIYPYIKNVYTTEKGDQIEIHVKTGSNAQLRIVYAKPSFIGSQAFAFPGPPITTNKGDFKIVYSDNSSKDVTLDGKPYPINIKKGEVVTVIAKPLPLPNTNIMRFWYKDNEALRINVDLRQNSNAEEKKALAQWILTGNEKQDLSLKITGDGDGHNYVFEYGPIKKVPMIYYAGPGSTAELKMRNLTTGQISEKHTYIVRGLYHLYGINNNADGYEFSGASFGDVIDFDYLGTNFGRTETFRTYDDGTRYGDETGTFRDKQWSLDPAVTGDDTWHIRFFTK